MDALKCDLVHTGGDTFGLKVKDPKEWLTQLVLLLEQKAGKLLNQSGTKSRARPAAELEDPSAWGVDRLDVYVKAYSLPGGGKKEPKAAVVNVHMAQGYVDKAAAADAVPAYLAGNFRFIKDTIEPLDVTALSRVVKKAKHAHEAAARRTAAAT